MKYFLKKILFATLMASSLVGCMPDKVTPPGDSKETFIKFLGGSADPTIIALDYKQELQEVMVVDIRRDANSEANLNKEAVINISNKQSFLDAYNVEMETEFELLPASAYTIVPSENLAVSGDNWVVKMPPGVFSTQIMIKVDASKFDLSKSYALALKIDQTSLGVISNGQDVSVVNVVIKNKYHGLYHSVGVFTHPSSGPRDIDEDKELMTSGATSVSAPLGDLGGAGYFMNLTVNPDNTVTITPLGATPNIDQSWGDNYYDPATKSFHLYYSYNTSAPRIIEEVISLK
jgi:hypothetical protein